MIYDYTSKVLEPIDVWKVDRLQARILAARRLLRFKMR